MTENKIAAHQLPITTSVADPGVDNLIPTEKAIRDALDGISLTPGPEGPAGPAGAAGTNGTNGTNGTDGIDGVDGAPGPEGPAGPAGDTIVSKQRGWFLC